jgi:hypothetical protein
VRGKRKTIVLVVVATSIVALGLGLSAQQSWQAVPGGGDDPPVSFILELDGTTVHGTSYELVGKGDPKGAKREYTLHVKLPLTSDSALTTALQPNQTFATATLTVFDVAAAPVSSFTLGAPKVVSYSQAGDHSAGAFTQEVVLSSTSFTAS